MRTYVWAPAGVGATGKVTSVKVPTTASGEYLLSAVRIDLSRELEPSDLRLFAAEPAVASGAVDVAAPDEGTW
jgi:hypothetical protein